AAVVAPKSVPGLKLAIKNEISELKDLYAKVGEFLDSYSTPYRSGYTVNLALEELVVNVIRYAFMDLDEHLIDISLSIVDQQLILVLEDDGRPFDPQSGNMRSDEYAEDPDDLEVGGLGLVLVLDMVDLLKYTRVNNRNRTEVRIKFYETEEPVETDSI
ncbi:MAG TPA: ATP-binding protein, partial [Pirellula sp.]|nr:ATP-binding protein [Pirellula sp.]